MPKEINKMTPKRPEAPQFSNTELAIKTNSIPGMLVVDLVMHGDERGSFKENFQHAKLVDLGFPEEFQIVQQNVATNEGIGVTRGIHAEPWNKFISLTRGEIFVAIVDLREGESFGNLETLLLTPEKALYLPAGCGNSYQTQTDTVDYIYSVDAHWSEDAQYTMVNLDDPTLAIDWPISLSEATVSGKDRVHPQLRDVSPMDIAS